MFCDFTEEVKCWLSGAAHPYVQSVDIDAKHPDNQSVISDGIKREDSASNISFVKENNSKLHSQVSGVSSTSSARIKAEADKVALMKRMMPSSQLLQFRLKAR